MARFKVVDQDNYEPIEPVALDTEDIVDRFGFIDPQEQIDRMINSGVRLMESRRDDYDILDGDAPEDVTKNQDFDVIDAQKLMPEVMGRIQADVTRQKLEKKAKEEEKQNGTAG